MTSWTAIGHLGLREAEELAEFLLYHMSQETRGKLMAERPVLYAKLYPEVKPATIIARSFRAMISSPACCAADKYHDPILTEAGCAQRRAG